MNGAGDEHVIEGIGRCRVVIRNGKVVDVGPPVIERCPLARRFAKPVDEITAEAVKANMEHRIASFGMCTEAREILSDRDFVVFGASELASDGLRHGELDAVVLVCEGAGTLITTNPALVQGIGGRMSGLVSTSPIEPLIRRIRAAGGQVLDPATAAIDQVAGADLAFTEGFRKVAVTVARPEDAEAIRTNHPRALIIVVHTTGLSRVDAERIVASSDIVTACASRTVREAAGPAALVQAGTAIPVYALTERGKALVLSKCLHAREPLLVKTERLPFEGGSGPSPLC
jgi:putative methanogenesis marker protein 8